MNRLALAWASLLVTGCVAAWGLSHHCQTGSRIVLTAETATVAAGSQVLLQGGAAAVAAGSVEKVRPLRWVACCSACVWSTGCKETAWDLDGGGNSDKNVSKLYTSL